MKYKLNTMYFKINVVFLFFFILEVIAPTKLFSQLHFLGKGGGANEDEALGITTDASGNTYVAGYFSGNLTLPPSTTLNASGLSDIFLIKVSPLGQIMWAKKAGGTSDERALGVACDASGNVYITGHFQGTANFDGITVTSSGNKDVFVAKYNTAGAAQWVRTGGGSGEDLGYAVAVGGNGNVYVTGEFKNTATFGTATYTAGGTNVFVSAYSSNGNFLWAKSGAGADNSRGLAIASDTQGSVYVTGQFSNNITFDNLQSNNILNAVFLVKFSSAGNEQWFRKIAGGATNIAYGLCSDNNSNIYITGDFTGNLVFFPNTTNPLTNPFPNKVFLAKYSSQGNMIWAKAHGSANTVSSRAVAVNASGIVYIGGWYTCKFSQYCETYGQGVFNSVGFRDGFVSAFQSDGDWLWGKNFGASGHDYVNALSVSQNGLPLGAATFNSSISIPWATGGIANGFNVSSSNITYCNDSEYYSYANTQSAGSSDFVYGNLVHPDRQPLDYYTRNVALGCVRDVNTACLINTVFYTFCPDTVFFCGNTNLFLEHNFGGATPPDYNYVWSTGATTGSLPVNTTGQYSVTGTSVDGCFTKSDEVYYVKKPTVPNQMLTDSEGFNNPFVGLGMANLIKICDPDSVTITVHPNSVSNFGWANLPPDGYQVLNDTTILVYQSGTFNYNFSNQFGCNASISVNVTEYAELQEYNLELSFPGDTDLNDTVSICFGQGVSYKIVDSLLGIFPCSNSNLSYNLQIPQMNYSGNLNLTCGSGQFHSNSFSPTQSGWYTLNITGANTNFCDMVPFSVSDSIYVIVNPKPPVNLSWSGIPELCPGDSILLVASGPNVHWAGNIAGSPVFSDSLWVYHAGNIYLNADTVSPDGCSNSASITINVTTYQPPVLTAVPGNALICPGDSVMLVATAGTNYQWFGPEGPLNFNQQSIYVNLPGFYYCEVTNASGCPLFTNTLEVKQYTTPFLLVSPKPVLCHGNDSTMIEIVTNIGSSIQWNAPFSGSSFSQIVYAPGTYSAQITSCGITTYAEITIGVTEVYAEIITTDGLLFCDGDSVILEAIGNQVAFFIWTPGNFSGAAVPVYYPGEYIATGIDSFGCTFDSDPILVETFPNNTVPPVVSDTSFCPPDVLFLNASGQGMIYWFADSLGGLPLDSGSVFQTPLLEGPAVYWVMNRYDDCSSVRVPLNLFVPECEELEIPNVFSPNGDGTNDFVFFEIEGIKCFTVEIYNRWGKRVFYSEQVDKKWYGNIQESDTPASEGVYFIVVEYCPHAGGVKRKSGSITLVR